MHKCSEELMLLQCCFSFLGLGLGYWGVLGGSRPFYQGLKEPYFIV